MSGVSVKYLVTALLDALLAALLKALVALGAELVAEGGEPLRVRGPALVAQLLREQLHVRRHAAQPSHRRHVTGACLC